MANYSYVMANFKLIKEGVGIYPPSEVVEMILKTSADDGHQNDDMSFALAGRWTYDNNLTYLEMQAILSWLRVHEYEGMVVEYAEYEEGGGFVNIGRATYNIRVGEPLETKLIRETSTWNFDEFTQKFLNYAYPDLDDYENEEDEDEEPDYDRYTEDCDSAIEDILNYTEKHMLGNKEDFTFMDVETQILPV